MRWIHLLTIATLAVAAGCASNMSAKRRTAEQLPANAMVAVLPFENLSGRENASEIVTSHFQTLLSTVDAVRVAEYGDVYDGLRRLRIRSSTRISRQEIDSLSASLGLDFLITGAVVEYNEREDRFLGTVPVVSYNCRLLDCRTGETVWVATSSGRGDKGEIVFGLGAIRSADNLARAMVTETIQEIRGLFRQP